MLKILSLVASLFAVSSLPLEGAGVQLFSPDRQSTLFVQGGKSGRWGWTKGHREPSDTSWLETAVREVKEESGFILGQDYYICKSTPDQYGKRLYWQGITYESLPQPFHNSAEHQNIAWVSLDSLSTFHVTRDVEEWMMDSRRVECDFD